MRNRTGWVTRSMLLVGVGLGGCDDLLPPAVETRPVLSTAIVSDPVRGLDTAVALSGLATARSVYVSVFPGTVLGERAAIRNSRTGSMVAVGIVDGGFDPVPIAADVGDTSGRFPVWRPRQP